MDIDYNKEYLFRGNIMDKNLVIDDVVKKIDTEKNIKEKYFSKMVIVPLISLAIGVFGSIMKINTG